MSEKASIRIIEFKPTVTLVASEYAWLAFNYNLCSEHCERIRRSIRATPRAERHSIAITFDYRINDLLHELGNASAVAVRNQTRAEFIEQGTGIPYS